MSTVEAGLDICKFLNIDSTTVLSIDVYVLHRMLIVKTVDGEIKCNLVPNEDCTQFNIVPMEPKG